MADNKIKGYSSASFMTIPQIKSAKNILKQKMNQTKDSVLKDKLESRYNELVSKERAINKFYERCMASNNPNLASMMRGKRLLLTFMDVRKISKDGELQDAKDGMLKHKADYGFIDFMKDIQADKIAMGVGIASMAMGAAALKVGNKSLLDVIFNAIGKFINANPAQFALLASGAALIAASKIIPSIYKTVRKVKNHAKEIMETENEISDEMYKDSLGFDHSALLVNNFESSKEKVINDLFNHPALLDYYKNLLTDPNSTLTSSQKLNLLKALKEVNSRLDDLERIKRGEPTKAEEAEIKKQQAEDDKNYAQVKQEIAELESSISSLSVKTPAKEIENIKSRLATATSALGNIKSQAYLDELLPRLKTAQAEFETKSKQAMQDKEQRDNAIYNEIENEIKAVSEFVAKIDSKTPLSEINKIGTSIKSIQAKIDGLEIEELKTKAQALLDPIQKEYSKYTPQSTAENSNTGSESSSSSSREKMENENSDSYNSDLKTKIENDISVVSKAITKLSSESTPEDFQAIDEAFANIENDLASISDENLQNEIVPKIDEVYELYQQKKDEINKHLDESTSNTISSELITKKLEEFENSIPEITAESLEGSKSALSTIYSEIEQIEDTSVKTNLVNSYNAVKSKLDTREKELESQIEIHNLNNTLDSIKESIDNMSVKELISVSLSLEKIEPAIYKTKDIALIQKYVEIDNAYIIKRNQIKGQTHDKLLDEINSDISKIRIDIMNINEENFGKLKDSIESAMASLNDKIARVPTTQTHFQERYKQLEADYNFEKARQERKAQNRGIHIQIDKLDPIITDLNYKLTSIEDFYNKFKDSINEKGEKVEGLDSIISDIKSIIEEIKKDPQKADSIKSVEKRFNKCLENIEELKKEYKEIEIKNAEIEKNVISQIEKLREDYKELNFTDKEACDDYIARLCTLRDTIIEIDRNPALEEKYLQEFINLEHDTFMHFTNEEKDKNSQNAEGIRNKLANFNKRIDNITDYTVESYNQLVQELESYKTEINSIPVVDLDTSYLEARRKLNENAHKSILDKNPEIVNNINTMIANTHSLIGAMQSPNDAGNVIKEISKIQTEIKKLPLGQKLFTDKVNELNQYLEKRTVKVSESDVVNEIKKNLNEMDSISAKLNLYNFEIHTPSMKQYIANIEKLLAENKNDISEKSFNILTERFEKSKKTYQEKHTEVQKKVDENNIENAEHKQKIDELVPIIKNDIQNLNMQNYSTLDTVISNNLREVGNLMAHICGNRALKTEAKTIQAELTQMHKEASDRVKEEIAKENLKNENTVNLQNEVTNIENEINALVSPSSQDIQVIQDKINNISKWSENGIDKAKIEEATSKLQGILDAKKSLIEKEEEIENAIEISNKLEKDLETSFNKLSYLNSKFDVNNFSKENNSANLTRAITEFESEVEKFNTLFDSAKTNLPDDKIAMYTTKVEEFKSNFNSKSSSIQATIENNKQLQSITSKINNVKNWTNKITIKNYINLNTSISSYIANEIEPVAVQINSPEINSQVAEIKSNLSLKVQQLDSEAKAAEARRAEENRNRNNQRPNTSSTTYDSMLKDAINNIIDQQGYKNAHIQTQEAYTANLAKVKSYIQKKLFLSEQAVQDYINPETGEYTPLGIQNQYLNPETDATFKSLLQDLKKSIAVNNKIIEKEDLTNINILESNLNGSRERLITRIANISNISREEASKYVDAQGNLIGNASNNSSIYGDTQVKNLATKCKDLSEKLNKYKQSNATGRANMSNEVLNVAAREVNRLIRNMNSNGINSEEALNKVCVELNINPIEIKHIISNQSAAAYEISTNLDNVPTPKEEPTVPDNTPTDPLGQEELPPEIKREMEESSQQPRPPKSYEEYENEIISIYAKISEIRTKMSEKEQKRDGIANKPKHLTEYNELNSEIEVLGSEVNKLNGEKSKLLTEVETHYGTEKKNAIKAKYQENNKQSRPRYNDKTITKEQLNEFIYLQLNDLLRAKESGAPEQDINKIIRKINGYLNQKEHQSIEGIEQIKQDTLSTIEEIKKVPAKITEPAKAETVELVSTEIEVKSKRTFEEELEDLNLLVEEYKKIMAKSNSTKDQGEKASLLNEADTYKELIDQQVKEIKRKYPEKRGEFAFDKDDVYKETTLNQDVPKESKVKSLKGALDGVDMESVKFKNFISKYKELYNAIKNNNQVDIKFENLYNQIKNNPQFSLKEKELYVAEKMLEIAKEAAEKVKETSKNAKNAIHSTKQGEKIDKEIDSENIRRLYEEGLTKDEIIKLTGNNKTKVEQALKNVQAPTQLGG